MHYTELDPPILLKRGRGRPCKLAWAAIDKGVVQAVFLREEACVAYVRRINKLQEKHHA